jgi:hypothetical protein
MAELRSRPNYSVTSLTSKLYTWRLGAGNPLQQNLQSGHGTLANNAANSCCGCVLDSVVAVVADAAVAVVADAVN